MDWNYYEMKLHSQSASESSNITHLSQEYVFYCIYKFQNFILKSFENALMEFVRTLPTLRRLWGVKAPSSDFRKNLLVPRNPKQSKKRRDVITLLWQLRCQYNIYHNKFWSLFNTAVAIVSR